METKALEAWRNRPMQVRVFEICPRCNKLAEGVQKRNVYGPWGQRFEVVSCEPCAPLAQAEYLGH